MLGIHDSHSLGMVAYAKVLYDGTAPHCNSGMVITKPTAGVYQFVLPQDLDPARTIVSIQAYVDRGISGQVSPTYVLGPVNGGPDDRTIQVEMFQYTPDGPTLADYAFDIMIFRTIVPNEPSDPT